MRGIKKRILALIMSFALAITMLPAVEPVEVKAATGNTVYYNFTKQTSCMTNPSTTYLFVPTNKDKANMTDFCLTDLPAGAAILVTTTTTNGAYDSSYFKYCVNVQQRGDGFDEHNGALRNNGDGTFTYKCTGGTERGTGYLYTYSSTTLNTSMVAASINNNVTISDTGSTTLSKDQVTMNITINSNKYKVEDYEFTDNTVNKVTKDNSLTVKFAGVPVNISVKFNPTVSDFVMTPTSGSTINIAGNAKNLKVERGSVYEQGQMGDITVAYYNATGTKLAEAPAEPGTYTVKISTTGGTMFNPVTDLVLGTYTIEHVYDKNKATCEWATDYSQATLSIPCAFCEDVKTLTAASTIVSSTATCLTKGTIRYQVEFKGQDGASETDWYLVDYSTETANGEDYTYYKEDFNMEPHDMTPVAYQAPTCTEKGKAAHYKCSKCGYLYADADGNEEVTEADIAINALGHDYGELVSCLDPTCTADGHEAYYQCGRCGNYFDEAKTPTTSDKLKIDKNGHNLISYSGRAATCTDEGSQPYWECSVCDALFSDAGGATPTTKGELVIPRLGHQFTLTPYQAPTCTTSGNKASLTCSVCHKTFGCTDEQLTADQTDKVNAEIEDKIDSKNSLTTAQISRLTIAALGHSYTTKDTSSKITTAVATCESNEKATYEYKCDRDGCSEKYRKAEEEIPNTKLGHDFGAPSCVWAADESSCTAKFTCQRSGCAKHTTPVTLIAYADRDNNRADGIAKQITSSTTATCTVGGIRTYKAEFAPYNDAKGIVYYEALDNKNDSALGHILAYTEGVDATCETAGTKAYWTCSRQCDNGSDCGLHFAAAGNHEDAANQAADAESLRFKGTSSSEYVADINAYKVIPAKDHAYGVPVYAWAADGKTATVTFTCANDASHKIVVHGSTATTENTKTETNVPVTASATTAATCTEKGETTYSISGIYPATSFSPELSYSDSKVVDDIAALNHNYKLKNGLGQEDFDWNKNTTTGDMTAKATFICANDSSHTATHEVSVTSEVTTQPTCTENGIRTYTGKVTFLGTEYTKQTTESIDALGHTYGAPTFTWSADGKSATATFTCIHDTNHKETPAVTVTSEVYKQPTCLAGGTTKYTAKVSFEGKEYTASTTRDDIAATGHSLTATAAVAPTCTEKGNIAYWYCSSCKKYLANGAADGTTEIPDINGDGVATIVDTILAAKGHTVVTDVRVEPTCEVTGKTEGTHCSVCDAVLTAQQTIPELGHAYGAPVFVWSEDGKSATATFTCTNDTSHKETPAVTVTQETIKEATCLAVGTTKYTAKVTFYGKEYSASTTRDDIAATGHSLTATAAVAPTCTEKGNIAYWYCSSCKKYLANGAADGTTEIPDINGDGVATIVDTILAAKGHTVVTDVRVEPTCEATGKTEGTHCSVCETVLKAQDEIPKLGHTYGEPTFTWSEDGKTATATFTCINDVSHKQTETATVTSDVETPAGCLTDGATVYYASVTFLGKGYSDIKIVGDLTATGHSLTHVEAVAPTCLTSGNMEYWYCASCDKYYAQSGDKTVDEIDDANEDGVITKADTILAATGHKLSYQKYIAPICEVNGYRESWYCVRCEKYFSDTNAENDLTDEEGISVSTNEIPKKGHDYDYTAPVFTWQEDGKAATVTFTCGNDETHEDCYGCQITSAVKTPATCTQKGVTTFTAKASVSANGIEYDFEDTKDVTDIPATGHRETADAAVPATCTKDGKTAGSHCAVCQIVLKAQAVVPKTGHSFTAYVPDGNATAEQDGTKTAVCDHGCGMTDTIPDDGSAIIVQNQLAEKEREESISTISEKLGVDEQTAREIQTIKESGTVAEEILMLTDTVIQKSSRIQGDTFGLLRARTTRLRKNSVTVKWTKVKDADGYVLYGCRCKKGTTYQKLKEFKGNQTFSYTNKGLQPGKYYKYIVVAYKNVNGTKVTMAVSKSVHATTAGGKNGVAKAIQIKKIGQNRNTATVTLQTGKTAKIKAVEVKKDKPIKRHRGISYESTDTDVATVSEDGMILAKGAGTCKIYVYAQNGVYKTIRVTVK